jgi:hypothetical protein
MFVSSNFLVNIMDIRNKFRYKQYGGRENAEVKTEEETTVDPYEEIKKEQKAMGNIENVKVEDAEVVPLKQNPDPFESRFKETEGFGTRRTYLRNVPAPEPVIQQVQPEKEPNYFERNRGSVYTQVLKSYTNQEQKEVEKKFIEANK